MTEILQARANRIQKIIGRKENKLAKLSVVRLSFFSSIFLSSILLYLSQLSYLISAPIVILFVIGFGFTIRIYNLNETSLIQFKDCYTFLKREILRSTNSTKELFRSFPITEKERNSHAFCEDLNIFDKDGIFPLIDTTCTEEGEFNFLQNLLRRKEESSLEINRRQEFTKLFTNRKYFSYQFLRIGSENWEFFLGKKWTTTAWKIKEIRFFEKRNILRRIFPVLSPLSFIVIMGSWIFSLPFGASFLILNLILFLSYRAESIRLFKSFESAKARSKQTEKLLHKINSVLKIWNKKEIQESFRSFKLSYSELWNSPVPHLFANILYLHDLWQIRKVEQWNNETYITRNEWIQKLEEVDSQLPFIHLSFMNTAWNFPILDDNLSYMEAEELSHPLLQSQNSISNPLQNFSKGEVLLITGSNMAGKTTFMRTVGINILFALCGGPILGKNFKLPSMKITCSLRNQDSLTEGISLFYAEAKRLGDIFKILKSNTQPILILLDEILKGTNTKERYLASEAILKNLQGKNTFTLCTTHDLELAKIPNLQLRHFTETISNNEMSFDFKIRDGVVSTTNALFILKREGVIV